jgi:hypothetical protein
VAKVFAQKVEDERSDFPGFIQVNMVAAFDDMELEVGVGVGVHLQQPFGHLQPMFKPFLFTLSPTKMQYKL